MAYMSLSLRVNWQEPFAVGYHQPCGISEPFLVERCKRVFDSGLGDIARPGPGETEAK